MGKEFQTINPATGEPIASYTHLSESETEKILSLAHQHYLKAKSSSVSERSDKIKRLAAAFRRNQKSLAKIMTLEMGKPLKDSLAEVEKCAGACDYFAENLGRFLAGEEVKANYAHSKIVKDSIGPILAIMPWNFPVWQVIRFAAPAVGIGNPILLKHSDLTAGSAEKIAAIFDEVETGLMFNLRIDHEQAAKVIADRRIAGVTLTGSAKAGREIAQVAGKNLKKCVLELGGSDAYVVFADSNVKKAAETCAQARMVNNGQSCVAAKRFIVEKSVLPKFLAKFYQTLEGLKFDDPQSEQTKIGTLASKKFQTQLKEQCEKLEKAGAEKVFDLAPKVDFSFERKDAFFPARVYKVKKTTEMAFTDEFFGPVALVFEFENESEALEIANKSIYGLGGAVFSSNIERAEKFARLMEAGFIAINDSVKSDAHLPFGGVKDSGFGRELSEYGFNEFCNVKTLGFGKDENAKRSVE
jgi:succinate-semialdehyde dehydrogenase / glutarate-semialdehyde dehydrogenase